MIVVAVVVLECNLGAARYRSLLTVIVVTGGHVKYQSVVAIMDVSNYRRLVPLASSTPPFLAFHK